MRLEQLAEETWTWPSSCRENVRQWCQAAGFEPRIGFETDDYQVMQSLVAAGMTVTLLPELLLTGRQPGLRVLDITPEAPARRTWAITRASDLHTPATEAMLAILDKQAQRLSRSKVAA